MCDWGFAYSRELLPEVCDVLDRSIREHVWTCTACTNASRDLHNAGGQRPATDAYAPSQRWLVQV